MSEFNLNIFCIYWSSFFLNQPCREIIDSEDNSHATSGDEWKPSEAASETDVSVQLPKLSTKVIIFLLENGKFEFSRKQYIFLKHSKREFCAEF